MKKISSKKDKKDEGGERLRRFLITRFSTLTAAADAFGKVATYFTSYVNGHASPGRETLGWLATQGCNLNWLLTGEGETLRPPDAEDEGSLSGQSAVREPPLYAGIARATPPSKEELSGMLGVTPTIDIDGFVEEVRIKTTDGKRIIVHGSR